MLKIIDKIVDISPTHNKRRLIITRDELQWILIIGHPEYDDANMIKSANKYYYPRMDYLLKDLLMKKYRASIGDLSLDVALVVIEEAFEEIKALGLEIEHNLRGLLHEST